MKVIRPNTKILNKLAERNLQVKKKTQNVVAKIIEGVRLRGDSALVEYTKKFDRVKLSPRELRVTEREISAAFGELDSSFIISLKSAMDNVFSFYKQQLPKNFKFQKEDGEVIEERFLPIKRVGIYVPAGKNPLLSSVYMTVIPAIVAGVEEIVICSPPSKEGRLNPYILATTSLLKIKEIYKIGGAQAIAALALGTETIRKVDKIVGPGNKYVTEAKRQTFGLVGIDMLAGPSEVVIVAGRNSNPNYILKDLEAQTEHPQGLGIVISLSRTLTRQLKTFNLPSSYIVEVKNLEEAAEVVNKLGPEHLELMLKQPYTFMKMIKNAGAIFIGDYSPVAIGDYISGPSHVLPTQGTSRFFSGLSVYDFLRRVHIINSTKKSLAKSLKPLERIANLENMPRHIESIRVRLGNI